MFFLLILGFVLLVKGADFIVKGATGLAKKIKISEMIIGILIVGIGSSICNILLVVGIASICKPVKIDKRILKIHFPIFIISIILLAIVCNFGGQNQINRIEAFALVVFSLGYIIYTIYEEKLSNKNNQSNISKDPKEDISSLKIVLFLISGTVFLKYGADFVVDGAIKIAEIFNISESIVSITIVAIGTSLPEIITSVVASINKKSDLALGNVIGSNIFNICLLPGIGRNYQSNYL